MKIQISYLIMFAFALGLAQETPQPILFDQSTISGVGLKEIKRTDSPERQFFQKRLFRGEQLSAYIVSLDTGTSHFENFGFDEYIEILHGEATVLPGTAKAQTFYSRDLFFAPKGFQGEWFINAGTNLHYELSVISTQRADSSLIKQNRNHLRISNRMLSGTFIDFKNTSVHKEVLIQGAELTISIAAEKPRSVLLKKTKNEKIIRVLSGQITLTYGNDEVLVVQTGDYFALPLGFTGTWSSRGHGLIKYLTIEKSDF